MSDMVVNRPDQGWVSSDQAKKDEWVRRTLKVELASHRRLNVIGKKSGTPSPWTRATRSQGEQQGRLKVGKRDPQGDFNRRLQKAMPALDLAQQFPPASDRAAEAAAALEKSLAEMGEAIEQRDFVTANSKLDEALGHVQTLSDEREAVKKTFDEKFYPLREKLNTWLGHTNGLTGNLPNVANAEKTARDAAAAAEAAADEHDYARAGKTLETFETAMSALGDAYVRGANDLNHAVTKKLNRLKRQAEALKGTKGLTAEAAAAENAINLIKTSQQTANSATSPEVRLAMLAGASDQVDKAQAAAQGTLTKKFNESAKQGLEKIRIEAGHAVNDLPDVDAKADLRTRLAEWDKRKRNCDAEKDLNKQKQALTDLHRQAKQIMDDALAQAVAMKNAEVLTDVSFRAGTDWITWVSELQQAVRQAIENLADSDKKTELRSDFQTAKRHYDYWISRPKSQVRNQELSKHDPYWKDLLKEALEAGAEEKRQAAYKSALEERFGLIITNPDKMANTHFDQFYEMLDRLPVQQTCHDRLKELTYKKIEQGKEYKGAAFYPGGPGKIQMGNFGAAETWDYQDPIDQTPLKMNAFNINSLHEIGHSVDDKYQIMAKNKNKSGCGSWQQETLTSVISAFIMKLKSEQNELAVDDNTLTNCFQDALTQDNLTPNNINIPSGVSDSDWQKVKPYLENALKIRHNKWPWGKDNMVVLNGRAYHEAFPNQWWSYDPSARNGTEVRDYQFRSPAEWFAELYAYTWFKKVKAPAGVDKEVTKYMYSPKA